MKRKDIAFNLIALAYVIAKIFFGGHGEYLCADFGISLIIAAIVAAAATTTAGVMQNQATKKANKEGLELAGIQREDTLAEQEAQRKIAEKQLAMSQRESELNRKERAEERGYKRMQNAANRYADYLNDKNALVKNRLTPLIKR